MLNMFACIHLLVDVYLSLCIYIHYIYDLGRYHMSDILASCTQGLSFNADGVAFC